MNARSCFFVLASLWGVAALAASCSATSQNIFSTGGSANATTSGSGGAGVGGNIFGTGGSTSTPCMGLECQAGVDDCAAQGKPPTTITGVVYDPAGKRPLYNVYVYIPNSKTDPIIPGDPTCTQCQAPASGSPLNGTLTDAKGRFTLSQGSMDAWGVPSGDNLPLVLQVGKWRRQLVMPHINACAPNHLPDPPQAANKLRLPAKGSEGDMPLIAFTSGCDPAECFLRNVGIADSEFVPPGDPSGHVHFYTGQDSSSFSGNASRVAGGNTWQDTYAWWKKAANLKKYDIVFNACECSDYDRGPGAYQAMHDYLEGGGRLFTTHYYYNWFAPPTGSTDLQGVVNWELPEGFTNPYSNFYIDSSFPKGKAFADWLQAQQVTTTYGQIDLADTRYDMNAVTPKATRWIYNSDSPNGQYATMYMSFNSPINAPVEMQCGRAVYSDVHLSGSSDDSTFPAECADADFDGSHATNESALEFLFFDLSSCVQDNSMSPPPPPPH
jgi:hypothetical protein